ncbi:MAG: transporter substrate-binding domain-containing protein [Desulfobacterales bacterium]|nr:transporter substrate-binding domain-containing protein [Desulfobacterales bacterium]
MTSVSYGHTIHVVTEDYPPYNFKENDSIVGVSTEVVRAVLKEAGFEVNILLYPWPRAYNMALENENTIIYSISRTSERETLFKWIGVVAPADNYLFALKKRTDITIQTLDEAKKYMIGTVRDDVADLYLIGKGFEVIKHIERASNYELNMKKLIGGRIDLWFAAELVGNFFLKKNGYVPEETVRKVYMLDEISGEGLYMAFSKKTSDHTVEICKKALEKIKQNGTYSLILKKHL